jgi:(p)ppGpp synthase/HD superfamily hydrolase
MNGILSVYPDRPLVVDFIRERHGEQKRLHGGPYYFHPISVTDILYEQFGVRDRNTLVAGDGHDLIEDTSTTYDELVAHPLFGKRPADLIMCLSKPPRLDFSFDPMQKVEAAIDYYKTLRTAPFEARIIKIADRIHNLHETVFWATNRKFFHRYLDDTILLMQALKGYVDQWQFDKLQHAFWEALGTFVDKTTVTG